MKSGRYGTEEPFRDLIRRDKGGGNGRLSTASRRNWNCFRNAGCLVPAPLGFGRHREEQGSFVGRVGREPERLPAQTLASLCAESSLA